MQSGSCHCGAVQFTAPAISAGSGELTTYTFNRHVIQHQFCRICGCQPLGLGKMPNGTETAAINVRCLHGVQLEALDRVQVNGREF